MIKTKTIHEAIQRGLAKVRQNYDALVLVVVPKIVVAVLCVRDFALGVVEKGKALKATLVTEPNKKAAADIARKVMAGARKVKAALVTVACVTGRGLKSGAKVVAKVAVEAAKDAANDFGPACKKAGSDVVTFGRRVGNGVVIGVKGTVTFVKGFVAVVKSIDFTIDPYAPVYPVEQKVACDERGVPYAIPVVERKDKVA